VGTSVRKSTFMSRAMGHARRPDPSTTPTLAAISATLAPRSKALLASAEKMSAGPRISIDRWFTCVMSGRNRRA
jgi:hypothetical protein